LLAYSLPEAVVFPVLEVAVSLERFREPVSVGAIMSPKQLRESHEKTVSGTEPRRGRAGRRFLPAASRRQALRSQTAGICWETH
jgi:hypothetical protein